MEKKTWIIIVIIVIIIFLVINYFFIHLMQIVTSTTLRIDNRGIFFCTITKPNSEWCKMDYLTKWDSQNKITQMAQFFNEKI